MRIGNSIVEKTTQSCIVGITTTMGSFFPVTSEELGLPSLHASTKELAGSWEDYGREIRTYWFAVGDNIRNAMKEVKKEADLQLELDL